jgi:hypothetical protein
MKGSRITSGVVMKHPYSGGFSISALISLTFQQEILGPNFVCGGYLPDLTPAHQVLLETGMMAGMGGSAFASPIIWGNRRKPISGKVGLDALFPIRSASMYSFSCVMIGDTNP